MMDCIFNMDDAMDEAFSPRKTMMQGAAGDTTSPSNSKDDAMLAEKTFEELHPSRCDTVQSLLMDLEASEISDDGGASPGITMTDEDLRYELEREEREAEHAAKLRTASERVQVAEVARIVASSMMSCFPDVSTLIAPLTYDPADQRSTLIHVSTDALTSQEMPGVSLGDYLNRFAHHLNVSPQALVIAGILMHRMSNISAVFVHDPRTAHRLALILVMIASKFIDDHNRWKIGSWAHIGGTQATELQQLEINVIFLLKFDLGVQPDEFNRTLARLSIDQALMGVCHCF